MGSSTVRIGVIQPAIVAYSHFCRERSAASPESVRAYVEANVDRYARLLDQAGERGCDITCCSEDMVGAIQVAAVTGDSALLDAAAEPVPGPLTDRLGEIARRHRLYVVAPLIERAGDEHYNTAVLIDRDGQVAGRYRKAHLPQGETEWVRAGDSLPVFATDFGRIGILICYDMMFPEAFGVLTLQGADIVFFPSAALGWTEPIGLATLQVRASDHSVHVAAAIYQRPGGFARSCIVNPDGVIVADAGYAPDALAVADVDLAERIGKYPELTGVAELRARLLLERRPDLYGLLTDARPPLAERYPGARLRLPARIGQGGNPGKDAS